MCCRLQLDKGEFLWVTVSLLYYLFWPESYQSLSMHNFNFSYFKSCLLRCRVSEIPFSKLWSLYGLNCDKVSPETPFGHTLPQHKDCSSQQFLKLLKFQPWFRISFGTLDRIDSLPCNSCKIKMWMHYIKAKLKWESVKYNQASSRLIVHWQKTFCFLFLGTEIQLNCMKLVRLPPFGLAVGCHQRCENLMASWVSEWCWTPSVDLLLLLSSACLAVGPWLPCWAFSFSEQLWSEQQIFFFSSHTGEADLTQDQEAQGPLAAVGPVCVFPCSNPLCQLDLRFGWPAARGLGEESQQVPTAALLPRLPTSGTHTG